MDNKTDLIIMLLMIIGNINFSIALMLAPVSAPVMVLLCVNIFTLLCLLGIYAHKLYTLRGEENSLNKFADGLVNCSDRVAPVPQPLVKFKKGDWIVRKDDNGTIFQIKDIVLRGVLLYYTFQTSNAPMCNDTEDIHPTIIIDDHYRLATPEEHQQHGITIDGNE